MNAKQHNAWCIFAPSGKPLLGEIGQLREDAIWLFCSFENVEHTDAEIDKLWKMWEKSGYSCRQVTVTEV